MVIEDYRINFDNESGGEGNASSCKIHVCLSSADWRSLCCWFREWRVPMPFSLGSTDSLTPSVSLSLSLVASLSCYWFRLEGLKLSFHLGERRLGGGGGTLKLLWLMEMSAAHVVRTHTHTQHISRSRTKRIRGGGKYNKIRKKRERKTRPANQRRQRQRWQNGKKEMQINKVGDVELALLIAIAIEEANSFTTGRQPSLLATSFRDQRIRLHPSLISLFPHLCDGDISADTPTPLAHRHKITSLTKRITPRQHTHTHTLTRKEPKKLDRKRRKERKRSQIRLSKMMTTPTKSNERVRSSSKDIVLPLLMANE